MSSTDHRRTFGCGRDPDMQVLEIDAVNPVGGVEIAASRAQAHRCHRVRLWAKYYVTPSSFY
jgi:hypothetical protein